MRSFVADRYELVRRIEQGPISTLYEGRMRASAGFARPVAVREIGERFAKDPRFVGTWAAAVAELAERPSPFIESVLDLIVEGRRVYFVTEWIEGIALTELLAGSAPLPWTSAARIVIDLLEGVRLAHERNPPLCHRGITLSAVRVSIDGVVKLMRFGVAAALAAMGEGTAQMERDGLWHPAPELRAGGAATPKSDLYGVGALAFRLLTRTHPDPDADLGTLRADVPPLLASLVERALREDPKERFSSADEMARVLSRLLRAEPELFDARALALAVRSVRSREAAPRPSMTGVAALAASIRAMVPSEPTSEPRGAARKPKGRSKRKRKASRVPKEGSKPQKAPVGLPPLHTMHVDRAELVELDADGNERPQRKVFERKVFERKVFERKVFERKERDATKRAQGLGEEVSEALPLLLKKARTRLAAEPTELLPAEEVERLAIVEPQKRPQGLGRARTEHLDADQVDRLTISAETLEKRPAGLSPAKTEFLDEDQVDELTLEET